MFFYNYEKLSKKFNQIGSQKTKRSLTRKPSSTPLPPNAILNQGHWASESTFSKFYRRETSTNQNLIVSAVLMDSSPDNRPGSNQYWTNRNNNGGLNNKTRN
ncbi:hypothetical protein OUZ56_023867 [Daphnia magna]|uniref:Uncharacterized protein n=1 Tax=Daphnia magna TaxID=35525 RepID=A0ABR0AZP4_9CRUS|nr:hypothetical protein OUZ56_023867 [Daphnia magna]